MNVSSASNLLGSPKIYTFKQTYLIVRDFDNIWIYHIDFTKIVHKKRWPQEKYSIVLDEDVQKKKKKKIAHDIFIHVFSNISGLTGD